jgi:cytochrome c553
MTINAILHISIVSAISIILAGAPLFATPAIGKKEKKACTSCHTKQGAKELNDAGKEYKDKNPLPPEKK